jgi:flagellar hook-associated protein 2
MSTSGVISGAIKWTGLASGTDFASVVDKLVAIEQRTITRQETWKTEWQNKITAISGLNTRLVSLKQDAQSKDIRSEFLSRKSTISDESIMSVVNTSTASLGSYDVEVGTNIADKLASHSFDTTATFGSTATIGDLFTLQVGDDPTKKITLEVVAASGDPVGAGNYELVAGSDMDQLVAAVNDAATAEGLALTASVTPGQVGQQRLVLTATDGGSANRITVVDDLTELELTRNHIEDPILTTILGSTSTIGLGASSDYSGTVNKTITFVVGASAELGTADIDVQWADTEGHSGKFTILSTDPVGKEYEVLQGVSVTFGAGRLIKNESFAIDCQTAVLQRGQDSGLAQTAKVVHSGFADQISPIHTGGGGKFVYSYQGIEHSVTVSDRMSLGLLAQAINSATDNPGVTASIVNDGQGTSTSYHLVLTGNDTGAESIIEISSDTVLNQFNLATGAFTVAREASNAMLKVDGFPSGADNWIQRRSNEVSDVIDGVIVTLNGVGTSTLTVTNDATAMRDKIVQLVESVNFCKTYILENTKWGGSNLQVDMNESGEVVTSRETANGLMIGNYGFQIAQTNLDNLVRASLAPFSEDPSLDTKARLAKREKYYEDNGLVYTTLSEIGINSDPDNQGLYKVEQTKLLTALQTNPEAVIKLFTFSDSYTDVGADGKPKQVIIRGAALALGEEMAKLTSDTDVFDDDGNMIQKGKGIMVTLQENYEGVIENINAKIAREERRIETVKQRLTDRFNRLETALQQLQDKQSQLESSLSSLSTGSS